MTYLVSGFQVRDSGVNLSELPFFGLDVGGDGFGGKKRLLNARDRFASASKRFFVSESILTGKCSASSVVLACIHLRTTDTNSRSLPVANSEG